MKKRCVQMMQGFDMGDSTMLFQVVVDDEEAEDITHAGFLTEEEVQTEVLDRLYRVLTGKPEANDVTWLKACFFGE